MKTRNHRLICLALVALFCVPALLSPALAQTQGSSGVKFSLKSDSADATAVDVKLSFNLKNGQKAVVKPSEQAEQPDVSGPPPALELVSSANPSYTIEALQGPESGWLLTATKDGLLEFDYRARFTSGSQAEPSDAGEAPGGVVPPRAVTTSDLKAFRAADVLLAPQNPSGGYVSDTFTVSVQAADGEKVLAPWAASQGSFTIKSPEELVSNFLAWGKMTIVNARGKGPSINVGFAGGDTSQKRTSEYRDGFLKIYDEYVRVLGTRPEQEAVTVLVTGAEDKGLKQPVSESLRDSLILFSSEDTLKGPASAPASRAWLGLWNSWSLKAKPQGGAEWLEEGLPWFYSFRVAGRVGLLDANTAYNYFSAVYADYLTDPLAARVTLAQAETTPDALRLMETKGAAVLAAMTVRLPTQTTGGSRDIEWFLGELAGKFKGLEGKQYTQVDVSEILEDGTGTSWDRFFTGHLGSQVVLASEWSTTDVFGSGGVVGSVSPPETQGSGKNWIYLAIAILVIFSIPFIFSAYIKRSIRLEVKMPKILPDWDEDSDDSKPAVETEETSIDTSNPAGEAVVEIDEGATPTESVDADSLHDMKEGRVPSDGGEETS